MSISDVKYYSTHKEQRKASTKQWYENHPTRQTWTGMKRRCYNVNNPKYHNYGGRGIGVCEEWLDFRTFESWALKNGYVKGLSIDRIDNDGDYAPENCRWITLGENSSRGKLGSSHVGYRRIAVTQLDLSGNVIINYRSIGEEGRQTGISRDSISFACQGKYKQAGGYCWRYA